MGIALHCMLTVEKLLFMIEALNIYLKQRVNLSERLGTLAILLLFLHPLPAFTFQTCVIAILLFFALVLLRVYDDLMQVNNDAGKPNREYINYTSDLEKLLILNTLIFCVLTMVLDLKMGCLFSGFLVVNHLLYRSFVNKRFGALILPLLKYPLLFCCFQMYVWEANDLPLTMQTLVLTCTALFFAFLTVDLFDEPRTEVHVQLTILSLLVSFSCALVLTPISLSSILIGILFFIISALFYLFKMPYSTYFFLILFTSFKIILL